MTTNTYPTSTGQRSQGALTVDNVFRRMLKVANPRDPDEVAKALLARYADDAQKIKREQAGVPISSYQLAALAGQVSGPLSSEIRQATDDLERDLGALVSDIQLKDIAPELRGLSEAVRDAAAMGLEAAKLALDPAQRDRAFAARRTLGDYARLTRMLGALTSCATALYCRVSQSMDMCGNLILVGAGEALAAAGVTRSGGLLQVPATELQSRRDAIIGALRRLLGTEGDVVATLSNVINLQTTGPAAGSAGALLLIVDALEESGAQDLRPMLDEGFVARMLDNLLDHAVATTPDSLRSMGSTAVVTSGMLSRFVELIRPLTTTSLLTERPFIVDYVRSLDSFIAGFRSSQTGYRLPFLARPPLLGYGFYGAGGMDDATTMLQVLAVKRSQIAELVDCLCCACTEASAAAASVAAKLLFDLDRAIDLFCLGTSDSGKGLAELHAAAYGYVFETAGLLAWSKQDGWDVVSPATSFETSVLGQAVSRLEDPLDVVERTLRERDDPDVLPDAATDTDGWGIDVLKDGNKLPIDDVRDILFRVLKTQYQDEQRWRELAQAWSPICDREAVLGEDIESSGVGIALVRAADIVKPGTTL